MSKTFTGPGSDTNIVAHDLRVMFITDTSGVNTIDGGLKVTSQRIRVDRVNATLLPASADPTATLSIDLSGDMDGDTVLRVPVPPGEALKLIHPDSRLVIYGMIPSEMGGGASTAEYLFDGYPTIQRLVFNANEVTLQITCTSLIRQWAAEQKSKILGRYFAPPTALAPGRIHHIEATPCIFNHRGRPNRAANPVTLPGQDADLVNVPCFTYDDDPTAKFWTVADVITYLLVHYWLVPFGVQYPLYCRHGLDMTRSQKNLANPVAFPNPVGLEFKDVIKQKADELNAQNKDVVYVLKELCRNAGLVFQQYTRRGANDGPQSRLLFSAYGEGGPWVDPGLEDERVERTGDADAAQPAAPMRLGRFHSDARGPTRYKTAADIFNNNEINQAELVQDNASVVSACTVVTSRPYLYEMTIGKNALAKHCFKPGWAPDTMYGDNLADTMAKVAEIQSIARAESPAELVGNALTMYNRYIRGPAASTSAVYASIGRFWVLNESGEFAGATYGRNGAQAFWAAAAYTDPFNFHEACNAPRALDRAVNQNTKDWFPRRRRFLHLISKHPTHSADARPAPIIMVSFDSGATWHEYPGSVKLSEDMCAMWLTDANLSTVKRPDQSAVVSPSVWEATVQGTIRFAITASIEGDNVPMATGVSQNAFVQISRHAILRAYDEHAYESRTAANSEMKNVAGWVGNDVDDTVPALNLANRYVSISQRRASSFCPTIPWITKDWLPGDLCTGIQPCGVDFISIKGVTKLYPQIIEVTWASGNNGQSTELLFDDKRTKPGDLHEIA